MRERTILHVDINSCYANIECFHNPSIRRFPVAVGGDAEQRHGIILAKNEHAKKFGIKTGEALWQARAKCPELIILKPNYELYLRYSRLARAIYADYSDKIEAFGLDENWIDLTGGVRSISEGERVAQQIRLRVKEELGVTVSVGVSWNKVFAKLGSDYQKPDAVTEFNRTNYKEKIWPLPVDALLYVGRATSRKLHERSVHTIGQLATADPERLHAWFGKCGYVLYGFANGLDSTPVMRSDEEALIKSIGNSTTTPRDLVSNEDASIVYYMLAESVAERLREHGFLASTVQISLRTNELFCFERQMKLKRPSCLASELHEAAMALLRANYAWQKPLRSIGIRATDLIPERAPTQLTLFADEERRLRQERLERAVDEIRGRFGHFAICRAVCTTDKTLNNISPRDDHVIHPVGYFKAV